jgi:uncharacterized protein (TIGR02118 family)
LADLVVLYKTPNDPAAFDKYYFENHIPLAKKLPGEMYFSETAEV